MPISEIDIQLIEKHLDKSLSETEQTVFHQRLEDADFAAEVQLYQKSVHAIYALGDNKLKMMLQAEETAPPQYKQPFLPKIGQNVKSKQWLAIAASFLIFVSAGYWVWHQNNQPTVQERDKLLALHFEPYKNYGIPTVRDDATKSNLEKAFSFYETGNYKEALTYFEKITPPQYLDDTGVFFEANAYLATNQAEKAIPILEKLSQSKTSEWQKHAEWYLACALSKTEKDRATQILEKIKRDTSHPFYSRAMGNKK